MNKTITAISTPMGMGGIAVIRISGDKAIEIVDKVFKGKGSLLNAPTHTIHYGHIVNDSGDTLDEVLVSVMRAPRTFTREDVVEISTHGGITASRQVIDALIKSGAYPAEAGEFTKRAFLNGRIDLSQAEAVIDIINSKTELAQKNAVSQLEGSLSKKINQTREKLVNLAGHMQVAIDYPDEDLEDITIDDIQRISMECRDTIKKLISSSDSGKILRDGISTAIVGKPNVGKSSLLNSLAMEERAIVTEIAGTTRDVIEEYVNLNGIPLKLLDTAGIRETEDIVEKIGVERSKRSIDEADFIIVMLDSSSEFDINDEEILEMTKGKKRIILINKADLGESDTIDIATKKAFNSPIIKISAKTGLGLESLENEIKNMYKLGSIGQNDNWVITNMRHKTALIRADEALSCVNDAINIGMPSDIVSIDINIAIESLGEITGATVSDDIVKNIFHNFCVGK